MIFLTIIVILATIFLILSFYCGTINKPLGHKLFGWHYVDGPTGFDGCSSTGTCTGCGKEVLLDSRGNWF